MGAFGFKADNDEQIYLLMGYLSTEEHLAKKMQKMLTLLFANNLIMI